MHPHVNPLEMVEVAVGVVDAAWGAIERRRDHAHHDAVAATWEDCVKLEGELIQERSENYRLKIALEELRNALHDVRSRSQPGDAPITSSPVSDDGCPLDLYERIQTKVDSPEFLDKLKDMREVELTENSSITKKDAGNVRESDELISWEMVPDELFESEAKEETSGLNDDGFILISQDDVIESLAAFVAKLIVSNPNAKKMTPMEMQEVIALSFARMEGKGRLKKLWSMAKFICSSVTWTTTVATTAVGLYKNPFIVRAIFKALTMSSRLVIKALV